MEVTVLSKTLDPYTEIQHIRQKRSLYSSYESESQDLLSPLLFFNTVGTVLVSFLVISLLTNLQE